MDVYGKSMSQEMAFAMESEDVRSRQLVEVIDCMVSQIRFVRLVVEDAQPYQLFVARQFVGVLPRDLNESVGKHLTYLDCILRPVHLTNLPFELHFLRVELYPVKGVLFSFYYRNKRLICGSYCRIGLNIPELLQK